MSDYGLKYIVCVSDTEACRIALRFACLRAQKRGGLVDVLHVLPPSDFQSLHLVADKMLEERREETEQVLKAMTEQAHAATGITTSIHIRDGNVGDEIVAVAREQVTSASLILAHNPTSRGTLIPWLMNQMGEKFFIPMLLIPPRLTQEQVEALS